MSIVFEISYRIIRNFAAMRFRQLTIGPHSLTGRIIGQVADKSMFP